MLWELQMWPSVVPMSVRRSSHGRAVLVTIPEQWQKLGVGEPGGQGPAAPRDRRRHQETPDPPAGSRGCRRCEEKRGRR